MKSDQALLQRLLEESESVDSLLLPWLEPHPAALFVGLSGAALGVATVRMPQLANWAEPLAWLALLLVVAGMLMFVLLRRPGLGWRVDFLAAQLRPVGLGDKDCDQAGASLQGEGWKLLCISGSKRRSLALEFRHIDGGRPLRVFQTRAGANREEHRLVSLLADVLARRLQVKREGLSL